MPILVTILFVSHFFRTICFSKKHYHILESLSPSLVAQNICKTFFTNVIIIGII